MAMATEKQPELGEFEIGRMLGQGAFSQVNGQ
jgi:hypothetical protein